MQIFCFIFEAFRRVFPIFFVANATVSDSIELGEFGKIACSIELHVRFDSRRGEFSIVNLKMLPD